LFRSVTKVRWLLTLSCVLVACAPDATVDSEPRGLDEYDPEPAFRETLQGEGVRVRIAAGNITSGNQQAYLDPGIRIFRGIRPDIALVQEFNYGSNTTAALRSFVDQAFGPDYVYYREPGSAQIPNGIVSRYPILEAGNVRDTNVSNRSFAWARIDIPGDVDLVAISVHLLTSGTTARQSEAVQLVNLVNMFPGDYVVLGGDFNTTVRTEPCVATLSSVLVTSGPYPVDLAGKDGTNASRSKPYDWVIGSPALDALEIPIAIGANQFPDGFVADTRAYPMIGDLAPAVTSDSGATNMQHMAVVREFAIPADGDTGPPASVVVTAPNGGESWIAGTAHDITWTAEEVAEVQVEVTLDGVNWTLIDDVVDAASGQLTWTVPAQATQAARIRVSAVAGSASDVSDAPFNITVPPPQTAARVIINEILANEPGGDVDKEYVEIVNIGDTEADLSGWTLADARQVRHTFPSGTRLAGHRALVVYGDAAGVPAGMSNGVGASTHMLSLSNSGDSVILAKAGVNVDRVSFTSTLTAQDGVSMNRSPDADPAASFLLHNRVSTRTTSPGTRADGASF